MAVFWVQHGKSLSTDQGSGAGLSAQIRGTRLSPVRQWPESAQKGLVGRRDHNRTHVRYVQRRRDGLFYVLESFWPIFATYSPWYRAPASSFSLGNRVPSAPAMVEAP